MGPGRGTLHRTSTKGHMTPLFLGGVALVTALHAPLGRGEGCFKMANHSGMSQIDECSRGGPERKGHVPPPPLSVWQTFRGTVA